MYDAAAYRAAIMADRPAAYWPLTSGRDRVAPVSWTGFERVRDGVWPEPPNTEEMPVTMLDEDTHDRMVNEIAIQRARADRAEDRVESLQRQLAESTALATSLMGANTSLSRAVQKSIEIHRGEARRLEHAMVGAITARAQRVEMP